MIKKQVEYGKKTRIVSLRQDLASIMICNVILHISVCAPHPSSSLDQIMFETPRTAHPSHHLEVSLTQVNQRVNGSNCENNVFKHTLQNKVVKLF